MASNKTFHVDFKEDNREEAFYWSKTFKSPFMHSLLCLNTFLHCTTGLRVKQVEFLSENK